MQKLTGFFLAFMMLAALVVETGCGRGYTRVRRHNPGDRSVTIVRRPKYKGVPRVTKPFLSSPKSVPNR